MLKNLTINQDKILKLAAFIGFLGFSLYGILRHEMWRDELQAWLLARDSSSLYELYQNMQYEGHPALWHLFLFGLNQITNDPLIMQLFHWLISLAIVYLISYFSPFNLLQKFSLCFGYFIFFEYTLISRNYNLAVLFACLFCVSICSRKRYILYALLLALLANTSVYGLILSLVLFLYLCLRDFSVYSWSRNQLWRENLDFKDQIKIFPSLTIIVLGWFSSAFQIMRIEAINFADYFTSSTASNEFVTTKASFIHLPALGVPDFEQITHASRALNGVWESYCPIPALFAIDFWDTNILSYGDFLGTLKGVALNDIVTVLCSISLLLSFSFIFLPNRPVFWTYVSGNLLLLGLHIFLFKGFVIRHEGFFLVLLVLCCWLFLDSTAKNKNYGRGRVSRVNFPAMMLSLIFTMQLIGGVYAVGMDYIYPFSPGKAAASFIQDNDLADLPIFGSRYRQASVLSGYLDKMIYYPEVQGFGSFWKSGRSEIQDEQQLLREIQSFTNGLSSRQAIAALTKPIHESNIHNSTEFADLEIDLLEAFDKAIVDDESFFLYLVKGK